MKKLTVFVLATALVISVLCIGVFAASAAEGAPCMSAADCTGTYENGICSANAAHYQPAVGNGVGANGQPLFEISNAGQLYWFAEHVNTGGDNGKANAILKADIDLNPGYTFTFIPDTGLVEVKYSGEAIAYLGTGIKGDATGENATFDDIASRSGEIYAKDGLSGSVELLSGIRAWTPIGVGQYTGSFYGNGKRVSGLYIRLAGDYQGLFGHSKGMIRHVGVINSYISAQFYVGGVVGVNEGDVIDCYNTGVVSIVDYGNVAGGAVGENYGDVTGCYNTGTVNGYDFIGGVVGENYGDVTGCYNTGTVYGYNYVGGVVGSNPGNAKSSYNAGNVSGGNNGNSIGGVVGSNDSDVVECYNTSTVSVGEYAVNIGGVAGANYGNVRNSYNTGNVSCGDNSCGIGGVAGVSHGDVRNSYNGGNISIAHNGSYAGGVVGYNYGGIRSSYSAGNVSSGDNSYDIGGVAGANEEGGMALIVNTYYLTGTAACGIGNKPEDVFSATAKAEAEFKNGTVAWLLNEFIGYDLFGQTLAGDQKDPSPVFLTDSNRIYFGYTTCDAAQTAPVYSNVSTATAEKPAHEMAAATCTAPSTCTVCSHTEGEALGHKMADATCAAPKSCTVCGHTEGEALGHKYDNACDADCNVCGAQRTVGDHADADGNELCDACGETLPKDGLSTGAIVGIVAGGTVAVGIGGFALFWFVIKKKKWSDLVGIFKK